MISFAFSVAILFSFSGIGLEYFLKRRSPASKMSGSFPPPSRISLIHVPLLARPPKRVLGSQVGQGSISPLILLVYRIVRVLGCFWAWEDPVIINRIPSPKKTKKNHVFFTLFTITIHPVRNNVLLLSRGITF
jgi:hypothetical protein